MACRTWLHLPALPTFYIPSQGLNQSHPSHPTEFFFLPRYCLRTGQVGQGTQRSPRVPAPINKATWSFESHLPREQKPNFKTPPRSEQQMISKVPQTTPTQNPTSLEVDSHQTGIRQSITEPQVDTGSFALETAVANAEAEASLSIGSTSVTPTEQKQMKQTDQTEETEQTEQKAQQTESAEHIEHQQVSSPPSQPSPVSQSEDKHRQSLTSAHSGQVKVEAEPINARFLAFMAIVGQYG